MNTWRNASVLIATSLAFAVSFAMLRNFLGAASPWLGLMLMFDGLGLAKVAAPFFQLRLPTALRAIRRFERKTYERMAVPQFGRLLRNSPLRFLNASVYRSPGQGSADLLKIYRQAESAEATHFWVGALFTPYIGYVWISGDVQATVVLLLVQLLVNIYPIFHLRLTRGRLDRHPQRQRG